MCPSNDAMRGVAARLTSAGAPVAWVSWAAQGAAFQRHHRAAPTGAVAVAVSTLRTDQLKDVADPNTRHGTCART